MNNSAFLRNSPQLNNRDRHENPGQYTRRLRPVIAFSNSDCHPHRDHLGILWCPNNNVCRLDRGDTELPSAWPRSGLLRSLCKGSAAF
jgi:hypothetical protein